MARIVSLHSIPKWIILDRGSQSTSRFWKSFYENMDTKLNFSMAYHRQTDGQIERTNQVLEVMLGACALQHGSSGTRVYLMLSSHIIIVTRPV
jgi:transposase InsO family protein